MLQRPGDAIEALKAAPTIGGMRAGDLGAANAHAWEVIEANEVDLPADMFAIINGR